MPSPQRLGYRSAHRIPNYHGAFDVECSCHGSSVIGKVVDSCVPTGSKASLPMAPLVPGHNPVSFGQRSVGRAPVQVCASGPSVEEQNGGQISVGSGITDLERTKPREFDGATGRSIELWYPTR